MAEATQSIPASTGRLEGLKTNLALKAFFFFKVPMIHWTGAKVTELNDQRCVVTIPLKRRNRNHLNSMYFGVLAVGADCAGGLLAFHWIRKIDPRVSLVFKDFKADFLRRPEGDVTFTSEDGPRMRALVEKVVATGERQHDTVTVIARCPDRSGDEPVAEFRLTISLKGKPSADHSDQAP
jgi:acyl-coenzyme A thioesterase PaaI-like protein